MNYDCAVRCGGANLNSNSLPWSISTNSQDKNSEKFDNLVSFVFPKMIPGGYGKIANHDIHKQSSKIYGTRGRGILNVKIMID